MSSKKKSEAAKVINTASTETVATIPDFFDKLNKKAPLLALGLIILIGFIVFKDYLLFEKAYYFKDIGSDSVNYLHPYLYHVADYISNFGLPKWSFNYGMGQSLFPLSLHDPFDIFLFLSGKDHIVSGTIYKEFTKIILSGIIFYYYLKSIKLSDYTAIIGCLFYVFCGFVIEGSAWQGFTFESFTMALLLLSFEQLFSKGKWILFPLPIFLICISQPFYLYVYGLFLALYAIFRLISTNNFTLQTAGKIFLQMIGLGLLGMVISAPFLIENIMQILESPRGSGTNSYAHILSSAPLFETSDKLQAGTVILRFFSTDILGSANEFKGWQNILEAPLLYCGLPCLILMPQVFPFLEKRTRYIFIVFISIWVLPLFFPYFRHAFWLFSGDYYRSFSFLVSFVFIYYSLKALDFILTNRKINLIILIVTIIFLFILLNYPYFPDRDVINAPIMAFVSAMIVIYGILLFFMSRPGSSVFLKYAFFLLIVVEVMYFSNITANDREAVLTSELSQKVGYNDYTVEAIKYIKSIDNSFYRVDKTYGSTPAMHYSLNDGMIQGYRGTSAYSPFNQEYYIKYLQLMGVSNKENENESRWANGLSFRPLLESGNSVKYILAKKNINPIWRITCDTLATFGDVKVFRNKFVIPFGYTYSKYVTESAFSKISMTQRDFLSLKTCVVADADVSKVAGMTEYPIKDTLPESAFSVDIYRQSVNELSKDTLALTKFENNAITGKISVSDVKMMYLSVPWDRGWTLKVDGQKTDKFILDGGMTGVLLKKGDHTIEMNYDLRYFKKGLYLSLLGLLVFAGLLVFLKKKENNTGLNAA